MTTPLQPVPLHPPLFSPAGQQAALGHHLLCDERCQQRWPQYNMTKYKSRRADVLRTIARAPAMTLAGPYQLIQGGENAIARLP